MLQQVLREIEQARGPLSLSDLARNMQIDRGTLEGMIAFWVRKGRIVVSDGDAQNCSSGGSCGSCDSTTGCPFAGSAPRTFVLVSPEHQATSASASECRCGCQ